MLSTNCFLNELVTLNEVAKKLGINFKTALMHLNSHKERCALQKLGKDPPILGEKA